MIETFVGQNINVQQRKEEKKFSRQKYSVEKTNLVNKNFGTKKCGQKYFFLAKFADPYKS